MHFSKSISSIKRPFHCLRLTLALLFLLPISLVWPQADGQSQPHEQQVLREYDVKAIYLYNFLQFVYWPLEKCGLKEGDRVEEIAVLGESPIDQSLKALQVELKARHGTNIKLRFYGPYKEGMDLSGCRLLFITQSEMKNFKKIFASIKDEAVLTVGDSEDCLEQGCMVVLLSRMNKVRWAVSREPAEQAGLRLGSRLLTMAVKIID